ncbi:MAG TPA: GNAT family N-acetyltransferase [Kofleriaceae bacterium]
MDSLAISVRRAVVEDSSALASLINDAYRVECFFVAGDRTNPDEIAKMVMSGTGVFLVLEEGDSLAAAIYLERRDTALYFGMLSVRSDMRQFGLGTRLVRIAEAMAEATGAREVTLKIVNLREELARWYKSLGYFTGGTSAYTHRPVLQPCHFVEMYKPVGRGRDADLGAGAQPAA